MSIPNQFPQLVAAARSGALQALALQAGQQIEGTVIGPAPNGGTQVQIAGQMLNLVLPTLVKAGETIKLEVQGSGAQLKLALQPAAPQNQSASMPAGAPAPIPAQPNTLPLPTGRPAAAPPQQAPAAIPSSTPSGQVVAQPLPTAALQPVVQSAQPVLPSTPASTTATTALPPAQVAHSSTPAPSTPVPAPSAPSPTGNTPGPVQSAIPSTPIAAAAPGAASPTVAAAVAPATAMPAAPAAAQPLPYPAAPPRGAAPQSPAPAPPTPAVTARPGAGALPASVMPQQPASTPPAAAPMPSTPQAALAQMVQAALPRQDGVTSLTQALTSLAGKVVLPEPVVRAAQQVLAGRVAIDGDTFDAAALQKAVLRSGVFQEASLAKVGTPLLAPQADMKSALLALRQTLTAWLGQQAPLTPAAQIPPPIRGHVPRAKLSDPPPIDPKAAPEEVGKQLLERTEAALSRVRLHQGASLPDPVAKTADWSMDLPVLVGQQQTLMQIQIHRDEHSGSDSAAERGWQMRFAINLPGMGEVGAQVSLRAGNTGVMLWAAERATSDALEADAASLRDALAATGLRPGAIIVRHGEPPAPTPAPSGHFVDSST